MRAKVTTIKILAILGTSMVWFPIILPLVGLLEALIRRPKYEGPVNFDYLLPAEFFPLALLGMILLVVAEVLTARKRQMHRKLVFWGLGGTVAMLVIGQVVAVLSGLASGETPITSPWWMVVLAALGGYVLALVALGVGGLLLLRDLFFPAKLVDATRPAN